MSPDFAVSITRHLLMESLLLCAPLLIAACVVSVVLSLLQTLTGVQEQTITTIPRIVIVVGVAAVTLPWMVHRCVVFTESLWTDLHRYLG